MRPTSRPTSSGQQNISLQSSNYQQKENTNLKATKAKAKSLQMATKQQQNHLLEVVVQEVPEMNYKQGTDKC
ncbi:MAG: hypothetical protein AAGA46_01655 [Cyanobacteria bacterium P01_F01_bin.13]